MLDPLSAFSVACNVLHVIELGVKVLSKAMDYRKSETGILPEQKDLRDVLQTLNGLNTDLQASLLQQTASKQHTVEETHLLEANNQCLRLSKELIDFLDRLKLRDKHAMFDSLRVSIKTLWHKDKMDAMEKSLSSARDNLNVAFLVYMKYVNKCRVCYTVVTLYCSSKQATQAPHNEILKNVTRTEGTILQAVASTSESLQDDIKSLVVQLDNISLDSMQQTVAQFAASHRDLLEHLSNRLGAAFTMHMNFKVLYDKNHIAAARQSVLDGLHFPQIRERKDHILKAHNETYQWILEPKQGGTQRWDDFISWIRASSGESRIYWVQGKIGSGKTTLLRFLDDNLSLFKHASPWAKDAVVVKASCFIWNAGNKLQKSAAGIFRTLLTQLFEQTPELIPQVVGLKRWQTARLVGNHVTDWTDSELQECLREYILCATRSRKVFLLVDGLDELEGTDEAREDLIDLLVALAMNENVKICLSSRPWNIFQDAFGSCPQLRLEDLTYNDISLYIRRQLYSNNRFNKLMQYDTTAAEGLVASLISKAAGVFLWVRLVVKQLLRGLRDGDSIRALNKKIEEIPAGLDDLFMRLMESIEPQDRKEASELLQLALYDEDEFVSLHSNRLLDFSFIEEGKPDFALEPSYIFSGLDFANTGAMAFRLESTMRKLSSRCMGLLECHRDVDEFFELSDSQEWSERESSTTTDRRYMIDAAEMLDDSEVFPTPNLIVDFLHRSLRDFLLTPKIQALLHRYTQGPYDARMFFRNARLVQLLALNHVGANPDVAVGLASYILSTLTVPDYRETPSAAGVATKIQPLIDNLVRFPASGKSYWYLCCVLSSWYDESSTFLTLAIDFGLNSYIRAHLTRQSVQNKEDRPILDYILRPRFGKALTTGCVGNHMPDPAFLNSVLGFGADPNQSYQGVPIWALFLCFIADNFGEGIPVTSSINVCAYTEALTIMIQNGADVLLPKSWLSDVGYFEQYCGDRWLDDTPDERFSRRFPKILPKIQGSVTENTIYAVSNLLEHFSDHFGFRVGTLKALVQQREAKVLASAPSNQVASSGMDRIRDS